MSVYGIEFGNTQACISTIDKAGNPCIIPNWEDGTFELACAVYFEDVDNIVVGSCAKAMAEIDGNRVVQFIKREIGKPNARTYEFDGKTYTPIEISALILMHLKELAEEQGYCVEDVVMTCPSCYGLEERNSLKRAAELAGLNVLSVLNESTAAAVHYCSRQFQDGKTILVYEIGSGAFDLSIAQMTSLIDATGNKVQRVTIIATGGNADLGGNDWDDELFNLILKACCDENGLTPDEIDVETRQLIRSRVETNKKKLSTAKSSKIKANINGTMTTIVINIEDFERLTSAKVDQTMNHVEEILQKAGNIDIDSVLLVGGSTCMPMIRNAVETRFPGKVQAYMPEHAVALGAAIYGSNLSQNLHTIEKVIKIDQVV